MRITFQERIESLKIGSVGAMAFTVPYTLFLALHANFLHETLDINDLFFKIGSSIVSGFLFAVTYRYVIRNDDNPHLRDGAVAAFSLVRGLVPLQLAGDVVNEGLWLSLFLGESFVCFSIARFGVDRFLSANPD